MRKTIALAIFACAVHGQTLDIKMATLAPIHGSNSVRFNGTGRIRGECDVDRAVGRAGFHRPFGAVDRDGAVGGSGADGACMAIEILSAGPEPARETPPAPAARIGLAGQAARPLTPACFWNSISSPGWTT